MAVAKKAIPEELLDSLLADYQKPEHDHVFARQELDGLIYQTLPEPADPNYVLYNEQAYRSGTLLPNSGRVRVTVASDRVTVDYLRSYLPQDATKDHPNGEVAFSYQVTPRQAITTR